MISLLQLLQANPCHPLLPGDLLRCKQDEVRKYTARVRLLAVVGLKTPGTLPFFCWVMAYGITWYNHPLIMQGSMGVFGIS